MNHKQILLLVTILLAIGIYFLADGEKLLSPHIYQSLYLESPLTTGLVYFLIFVLCTALCLPVTAVMSVISGLIFGHLIGLPIALLASTCGGALGCLLSRYILRDLVQRQYATQLETVNQGIEKDGVFYLVSLRMIPIVPFWLLNLLVGLTPMTIGRFFTATLLGMIPVMTILVHFGTEIGAVEELSLDSIFTPGLLISLALLATLPLLTRGLVTVLRRRRTEATDQA